MSEAETIATSLTVGERVALTGRRIFGSQFSKSEHAQGLLRRRLIKPPRHLNDAAELTPMGRKVAALLYKAEGN